MRICFVLTSPFALELVSGPAPLELVIASWCGRKAKRAKIVARPGWSAVSAVKSDQLYEVKSAFILQPGPALFTDGAAQIARIIRAAATGELLPPPRPGELRTSGLEPRYPTGPG